MISLLFLHEDRTFYLRFDYSINHLNEFYNRQWCCLRVLARGGDKIMPSEPSSLYFTQQNMHTVACMCILVFIALETVNSKKHFSHVSQTNATGIISTNVSYRISTPVNMSPISAATKRLYRDENYTEIMRKAIALSEQKGRRKIRDRKQLKAVVQAGIPCMKWKPEPNITTFPDMQRLVVDYCLPKNPQIPRVKMCLEGPLVPETCAEIFKHNCSHIFENMTAGNFTLKIMAICDTCREKRLEGAECLKFAYKGWVVLKAPSVDEIAREKSSSYDATFIIIISTGCPAFIILLTVSIITWNKRKLLPSCSNCCRKSQGTLKEAKTLNTVLQPAETDKMLPPLQDVPEDEHEFCCQAKREARNTEKTEAADRNPRCCDDCHHKLRAYFGEYRPVLRGPQNLGPFKLPNPHISIPIPYHLIEQRSNLDNNVEENGAELRSSLHEITGINLDA